MKYQVNNYELNTATRELSSKGIALSIEPLIFSLLIYMIENPNRVLSHDELIDSVWSAKQISNSALCAAISAARQAIGDNGRRQQCIKTVSGHGYRFIAAVAIGQQDALALPEKPSVAVLDFLDQGTNDQGLLLACGLTVDITACLARLPHFFVIARGSAANLQLLSPGEISQRLGVRYLVQGRTQRLANRAHITISVIDAIANTEIWSEFFNRSLDDIFLLQSEITTSVVYAIDKAIEQAEIDRALLLPVLNLNAWEAYHRGMWHIDRPTIEDAFVAHQFFSQAVELDANFSRAYAGLSIIHTTKIFVSAEPSIDEDMALAFDYAQQSISCCRRDTLGHWALGKALFLSGEHHRSLASFEQAVSLNQNYAHAHLAQGVVNSHNGHDSQALLNLNQAQRLNPYDPLQFSSMTMRAILLVNQGEFEQAAAISVNAADDPNAFFTTYAVSAACLELVGQSQKAQQYAKKALSLQAQYSVELYQRAFPHTNELIRRSFIQAMYKSGIPLHSDWHD